MVAGSDISHTAFVLIIYLSVSFYLSSQLTWLLAGYLNEKCSVKVIQTL